MHVRYWTVILDLAAGCAAVVWLYLIFGRGLFWRLRKPEAQVCRYHVECSDNAPFL